MNEWMERAIVAEAALQTMAALFPDEVWEQYADERVTELRDMITSLGSVIASQEKDAIRLREVVGSLVEYAEELLADRLERYGETTKKNREWAKILRDDIAAAKKALQGEKEE